MEEGDSSAFVPPSGKLSPLSTRDPLSVNHAEKQICTCRSKRSISRRSLLRQGLLAGAAAFFSSFTTRQEAHAADTNAPAENEPVCSNCQGTGKVLCELCSGTGFWRALAGSSPKQRYKGVVCPECEGVGTLTCPVCLGTGEGDIKGLLRRRRVEPGPGRILQTN